MSEQPRLDTQAFNNPDTEQKAIEEFAFAVTSVMEQLAVAQVTFDKVLLPESSRPAFEKNLKRCVEAVMSTIPNQYKTRVFEFIQKVEAESDAPETDSAAGGEVVHAEQAQPATE